MQMGKLYSSATLNVEYFPFLSFLTPHTTTPRDTLDTHVKDIKHPSDMYVKTGKHPCSNTEIQVPKVREEVEKATRKKPQV